jgi:hypothetical protein
MSDEHITHDADGNPVTVGWAGRTQGPFPEVAEALGVPTDLIMAAHEMVGGRFMVIYTPDWPQDPTTGAAALTRRPDGMLQVIERERRPEIGQQIAADLRDKLGDAPE